MASQRVSREIIDGIEAAALECPLCMDRFTNPKSLSCMHSFCLGCIEKWVKESNGKLSCPTCREDCLIPTGGLQKLKNNIFITGLLDYVTTLEQKSAPACGCKKDASFCCRDCDELYCRECKDAHRRMKISSDHSIITLKEYNTVDPLERFASKSFNCSEHNMPLHFFCDTCKKPVCVGCTLVQHKGDDHNIVEIKNAFEAFSTNASQLIRTSHKKILGFRQMVKELKEKEAVMNSNYSKCKTDITRQADELHRLIDRHTEDQMQNLESSHKQKLKLLGTRISDVELAMANLSSMHGITHNLANSPNKVMALMSSSGVTGKLSELLKDELSAEPQELGVLEYNPNSSRLSQLFGKEVVDKLRGKEMHISSDKSTIEYYWTSTNHTFNASVTTRNTLGKTLYLMDAGIKCFGIDRKNNDRIMMEEISVTDQHNGCYEIRGDIPKRCTLIFLIIDRYDVYVNTIECGGHEELCNPSYEWHYFKEFFNFLKS